MARSLEQRLEDVQSALRAIEAGDDLSSGQSVSIRGRMVERPDYRTLLREERRLRRLLSRKQAGGIRVRRGVPLDG